MRLFDADKLQVKHYLQRSEHPIGYEGTQAVYDYKDVLAYDIESAETVEAVEVVRCKDCKWWKTNYMWNGSERKVCVIEAYEPIRNEDDYCSRGERK